MDNIAHKLVAHGFPRSAFTMGISLTKVLTDHVHKDIKKELGPWMRTVLNSDSLSISLPWLYIHGDVGEWKTAFAALLCHSLIRRKVPFQLANNYDVYFYNASSLFDYIQFSFNNIEKFPWDNIKSSSMLVVDDFGTEPESLATFRRIYELINYRYENSPLLTVFTSNYSLDAFVNRMALVAERLTKKGTLVDIDEFSIVAQRIQRRIIERSLVLKF